MSRRVLKIITIAVIVGLFVFVSMKLVLPSPSSKLMTKPESNTMGGDSISLVASLPPDPGEAGKATLEGVDLDGDGIRDDIQRYIALTHSDSKKTQAALTQRTKVTQAFMIDANNKDASINHSHELNRSIDCLHYIRDDDARKLGRALEAEILNTKERSIAYLTANNHLGGQVYALSDDEKSGCDFDPDGMKD